MITQVPTINRTDQTTDWFGSLQRCFNWSDRVEQKPLSPQSVDAQQALILQYSSSFTVVGGGGHGGDGYDGHAAHDAPSPDTKSQYGAARENAECVIDNEWSAAGSISGTHAVERWTAQRVVGSASINRNSTHVLTNGVGSGGNGNGSNNGLPHQGGLTNGVHGVSSSGNGVNSMLMSTDDSEDASSSMDDV